MFVDLAGKKRELAPVLFILIDRGVMFTNLFEKMGRVRWRNSLGGKMAADVQISRVFAFLDDLMVLLRFPDCFLLRLNIVGESFVAPLVAANFGDIFFDGGQFLLRRCEFLFGESRSLCAAEPRPNQFSALIG